MNYEQNFKKNGIELNKELPSQIKKRELNIIAIKCFLAILVTNLLTFILLSPVEEITNKIESNQNIIPENYIEISIPLKLMVPHTKKLTKVSIHNKRNKVICREAYLIGKKDNTEVLLNDQLESKYKVLIHNSDLIKIISLKDSSFWAFPFNRIVNTNKKRKPYEINF